MTPNGAGIDYQAIAIAAGYLVMGLLSFLGINLWNDVRTIKEKWITREEFKQEMGTSNAERDKKHLENTGNFRRIDEKLDRLDQQHNQNAVHIEKRLGEVLVQIEKTRPPQRADGPERRRY